MKILHVYRTYFPDSQGGLEESIRQLSAATTALGVQNRIFSLSQSPDPPVLSCAEGNVYRFPLDLEIASCSISLRCLAGFRQLVAWADVIHYHFPWPFADLLHFVTRVSKPTLLTYHADIVRQRGLLRIYQPLMHRFLGSMDAIVATSPNYAASSPILNRYSGKIEIIPIGLDPASYPSPDETVRSAVQRCCGREYFLFVGVLRYYKGLHFLLEAARQAPFSVVIVGDGPLAKQLRKQAADFGLGNINFLGYVDDATKVALYEGARAVIFPSYQRSEAFGVTLVEGAMFAKPLISTEIGAGMSYINQHGKTGLIVAPGDAMALRRAMDLLHHDPDLAQRLGLAGHRRFVELFHASQMAEQYHRLYKRLLA